MYILKLDFFQKQWFKNNVRNYRNMVSYEPDEIILMVSEEEQILTFTMISNDNDNVQCMFGDIGKVWHTLNWMESKQYFVNSHDPSIQYAPVKFFQQMTNTIRLIEREGKEFFD